jgi:hypothetical protein
MKSGKLYKLDIKRVKQIIFYIFYIKKNERNS